MSVTIEQIHQAVGAWAPWDTAEEWDNAGLLVRCSGEVTGVLCTLDITREAVEAAKAAGCNTIVSHHPVVFRAMKTFDAEGPLETLLREGVSAVCAHTNLDKAAGGVSETLARRAGLEHLRLDGFCCVGELPRPVPARDFAAHVGAALSTHVKFTRGDAAVRTVCAVSGAGGDLFADAASLGADCLLTGEASHHEGLDSPIPIIAASHHATEVLIVDELVCRLAADFPGLKLTAFYGEDPFTYL